VPQGSGASVIGSDAGQSDSLLVVGATSAIAQAVCRRLAQRGWSLVLTGRDEAALSEIASDLRIRGSGTIETLLLDPLDYGAAESCFQVADGMLPSGCHGILVCHGLLFEEKSLLTTDKITATIDVNFTSVAILATAAARLMELRGRGVIAVISSVAGDRGRQSNFTYGAAKAGLTAFMSGLRNRLHVRGIHVLTIKPGIVDTPMTRQLNIPLTRLVASPDRVAADIEIALTRRTDVLYTPRLWRVIMLVIRIIPETLFKRMRL
jgi:decaprenylphospho-beta-D-erythro-pentofuranosid-2-ulose 2-reductase